MRGQRSYSMCLDRPRRLASGSLGEPWASARRLIRCKLNKCVALAFFPGFELTSGADMCTLVTYPLPDSLILKLVGFSITS